LFLRDGIHPDGLDVATYPLAQGPVLWLGAEILSVGEVYHRKAVMPDRASVVR
jgi:hypothetical protein